MSGELATQEFSAEQVQLITRTICKGGTPDEVQLFLHQCRRTGLDPLSRQIHAVKRWDSNERREVMSIQTGIDGFRLIAERTGKYAGNDDPVYDVEDAAHPNKATVTVWKIVAGQRVPFSRSARWSEFAQTKKDGSLTRFWQKMPYLMLGKVAEALALRAAFPQELSGLYTADELGHGDDDDHAPATQPRQQQSLPPRQEQPPQQQQPPKSPKPATLADLAKAYPTKSPPQSVADLKKAIEYTDAKLVEYVPDYMAGDLLVGVLEQVAASDAQPIDGFTDAQLGRAWSVIVEYVKQEHERTGN